MLASLGLCLRHQSQFLTLAFFAQNNFGEGVNKKKRILPSMTNHKLSKNIYLEIILVLLQ
jgi:hypothetical protein